MSFGETLGRPESWGGSPQFIGEIGIRGMADGADPRILGDCGQTDPEAFYPEKGGSTREAKAVCHECPVEPDCLEYALENRERWGVWGGTSERERRKMQQQRKQA